MAWVICPAVAATAIQKFGFSKTLSFIAFSSSMILFAFLFMPKPSKRTKFSVNTKVNYSYCIPWICIFTLLQSTNAIITMVIPLIIVKQMYLPISFSGYIFTVCSAIEVPLFLLISRSLEKFSFQKLIIFGSICGSLYYFSVYLANTISFLMIVQLLNAIFIVITTSIGITWFQNTMPNRTGLATGIYMNTSRIGSLLGIPISAWIIAINGDDYRIGALISFTLTVIALGILSLLVLYDFLKKKV